MDHQHRSRRPDDGAVRGHGERPAEPAEAAGHPGHQRVQGPHVPHQPLGLRVHRRRLLGRPDQLADKRVGIIGTGATAIQCIPHLGDWRRHLYVFQRTPSSVDVRNNRETDPEWVRSLDAGWQQRRMDNFNILVSGGDQDEDLVQDGWTDIFRNLTGIAAKQASRKLGRRLTPIEKAELMELADFQKMEPIRARVESVVEDPATAEKLKPWYRQFCKRPCFHDEYLQTYNRPNVTLVDTDGKGVTRLTENAVVVGDDQYEVDCLIFATGFEVGTTYTRRAGYDIVGRDGVTLSEKWANGLRTLHGLQTQRLPELLLPRLHADGGHRQRAARARTSRPGTSRTSSRKPAGAAPRTIEVTAEAEQSWLDEMRDKARLAERFYAACTPGYYNNEGNLGNPNGFFAGTYGAGPIKFFQILEEWRGDGQLRGVELH